MRKIPDKKIKTQVFFSVTILSVLQCLYAQDISVPLPDYKIHDYPFNMVGTVDPGERITDLGMLSGNSSGVAISQKIVLSAAHVFFNADITNWWPGPFRWNLRHSPSNKSWDMSARSYHVFSDYAEATRRFYFGGSPSPEQQNRDVMLLIFYEDVADGGWAGRGINRIQSNVDKMIVGYPSSLYEYRDPRADIMHSTSLYGSPAKFTLLPYANNRDRMGLQHRVYGTNDLSSSHGGSGGPVFGLVPFTDGTFDWGVVGIVVGGAGALSTYAVNFDEDVYDLLKQAEATTHAVGNLILDGSGDIVGENIKHPNGNIFNQILLTGPNITFNANPRQITRVSFLDENGDIVQVEFSGTGYVTLTLDPDTYLPPSLPSRYNQQVKYVTGKASVVINSASSNTFFSIFTVGRINAINQSIFPIGQAYDAQADVKLVEVAISSGIGGMQLSNTFFSGDTGKVGVDAFNTPVLVRLTVGDIDASGDATPYLLFGEESFTVNAGNSGLRITGGDLFQSNGAAILTRSQYKSMISQDNFKSDGTFVSAKQIRAAFIIIYGDFNHYDDD